MAYLGVPMPCHNNVDQFFVMLIELNIFWMPPISTTSPSLC